MPPTVSINLCCYNSERYLRETMESIVNQTYKDWELVIINDGSSDSTGAIINKYLKQGYPIIYHYQENKGLGYSRNEALKRSQGEFIAFIDHDDIWMPDKLELQIPLFRKNEKVAIVISNAVMFNDRGDTKNYYKKKAPKTGYVFREILGNNFICLSSAVIRKYSLNNLNEWFDIRFNHIEEAELFARIAYDWQLDYVHKPLVKNRIHERSSTFLRPELSPTETEMMIEKFMKSIPVFEERYCEELLNLRYHMQYSFALTDWQQGKNLIVRERLRPFLLKKVRANIPFLLSFFPYSLYKSFLSFFYKHGRKIPRP